MTELTKTLYDGTKVSAFSVFWMQECEERYILSLDDEDRAAFYRLAVKVRGDAAVEALKQRVKSIEPHFVLGLADKELRVAYLDRFRRCNGPERASQLESAVRALWRAKRQKTTN